MTANPFITLIYGLALESEYNENLQPNGDKI